MATVKSEAFLAKLEYIEDTEGKRHYIYPMRIKHLILVTDLFAKINDEIIVLNLPTPLRDDKDNIVRNNKGEVIIDTTAYDAMCEILELALNDTYVNIADWIDLRMIQEILDIYSGLSGLKKKLTTMMTQGVVGKPFLQA